MATPDAYEVATIAASATLVALAGTTLAGYVRSVRAERALAKELAATVASLEIEKERWQLAFAATAEAVWDYDLVRRTLWLGPGFSALVGRDLDHGEASVDVHRRLLHPDDAARLDASIAAAVTDRDARSWELEYRMLHADGTERPVHARGVIRRDADGKAVRIVGTLGDRTAVVRESESRLAARKLESVGVLAGGIAHDFNNLLTSILGNVELAKSRLGTPDSALPHLELVENASRTAAELTRQLLAYSGRGRIVVAPTSLDRVVRDVGRALVSSFPPDVSLEIAYDSHDALVDGDVTQLQQIVMNLVANAVDAIGATRGVVHVRTSVRDVGAEEASRSTHAMLEPGRHVVVEVEDTGRGMAAETIERMFDPFFTTKETGRGLGLSAILGILRSHQGGLSVTSVLGSGSRFVAYFPPSKAENDASRVVAKKNRAQLSGRVLVVDDEEAVRVAASAVLRDLGLEVVTAEDGRDALDVVAASASPFDLVLLDLTMPRLDGHSTLERLRGTSPELPIVLSSGYSAQEVVARYANDAWTSFLPKPWRAAHLVDAVRSALVPVSGARRTRG